jgi:hypothetical protein
MGPVAPVSTVGELSIPFGVTFDQGQALRESMGQSDAVRQQLYQQDVESRRAADAEAQRIALERRRFRQQKKTDAKQLEMQERQVGVAEKGLVQEQKQFKATQSLQREQLEQDQTQFDAQHEINLRQMTLAENEADAMAAYRRASLGLQRAQLDATNKQNSLETLTARLTAESDAQIALTKRLGELDRELNPERYAAARVELATNRINQKVAQYQLEQAQSGVVEPMKPADLTAVVEELQFLDPKIRDRQIGLLYATGAVDKAGLARLSGLITDPGVMKVLQSGTPSAVNAMLAEAYDAEIATQAEAAQPVEEKAVGSKDTTSLPKELYDKAGVLGQSGMYGLSGTNPSAAEIKQADEWYSLSLSKGFAPEDAAANVKAFRDADKLLKTVGLGSLKDSGLGTFAQRIVKDKVAAGKELLKTAIYEKDRQAILQRPELAQYPDVVKALQEYMLDEVSKQKAASELLPKLLED